MAKKLYFGVGYKAKTGTKAYYGVGGISHKVLKKYIGDSSNKSRLFFDVTSTPTPPTPTTKTYYWDKYDYDIVTTYYGDSGWGASEDYDVESVSGYTSCSFSASSGFVGSGNGTLTQTGGSDVYDVSSTEAYRYYYDSSRNMICRQRRTCYSQSNTEIGSYLGQVSSTNTSAYPDNGTQGGYWYIYDRAETT